MKLFCYKKRIKINRENKIRLSMDFDILGCSFHMAYVLDIPSFEEAFDTDSLRKFYGIQAPSVILNKSVQNLPVEEDAWFQNLDFLSPSPSQNDSQYFFDFPTENNSNEKVTEKHELETNKNVEQTSDMIASICQQIQLFYDPEANSAANIQKKKPESSILKKLINKEEVFIIHKRKNKTKSPPSSSHSSPLLQKNVSINLSTTNSVSDCDTNYTNDIIEKPKSCQKVVFGGLVTDVKNLNLQQKQYFF